MTAISRRHRARARRGLRSFVLLEVLLSVVIAGVTLTAVLDAFITVLGTMRDKQTILTASLLAESLMAEYQIEPPEEGDEDGWFADDPRYGEEFERFSWRRDVESFEPDYDDVPSELLQELEHVYEMELTIYYHYDRRRDARWAPVRLTTYIVEPTIFTEDAMFQNQLF